MTRHNEPSQTGVTVEVSPAVSTTTATASRDRVKVKKGTTDIDAVVQAGRSAADRGGRGAQHGTTELGRATLSAGRATVTVGPFGQVGTKTLTVRYLGDARVERSTTTVRVEVVKGNPRD